MGLSITPILCGAHYKVDCIVPDTKWKQNGYLVSNQQSKELILIDPGDHPKDIIRLIGDNGGVVRRILITHPHHDHIGAAAEVANYFKVPCEFHKADIRLMMHAPMYAMTFAGKCISVPDSYQTFDEESFCAPQSFSLRVMHTPGHTKGSVCYLFDGFAFTGDTILYKHVGRTDLPGGDGVVLRSSISRLLANIPEETLLMPGHGTVWKAADAAIWWREARDLPPRHDRFETNLGGEYDA